ncbi:DUF4097 family beta strand repeat-containing protein [Actinomadura sp. 1N219]|uniref:DUF4097 family beta strand repeat-containing protein n=1 Tax=Actinomadura sp. 1N219 TaxID=3375152 RepID=UPI00379963CF
MAFASTFDDNATLDGEIKAVHLDNIDSGSVTLRGGASKASLRRTVEYRGDKPTGQTHRVENGVLKLRGCGNNCSVRYTIDVPAGLPVDGATDNGSIKLSRVGAVNVSTDSGSIHLDDVAGSVKAKTDNGKIEGRGLKGDGVDVRTDNGKIVLTPAKPQNIRAVTSNGGVTVTVPAGRYRVSARTDNGDPTIGIANDASAPHRLDLTTDNGDINVKPGG